MWNSMPIVDDDERGTDALYLSLKNAFKIKFKLRFQKSIDSLPKDKYR